MLRRRCQPKDLDEFNLESIFIPAEKRALDQSIQVSRKEGIDLRDRGVSLGR
jgi:hypothetical protein